MCEVKPACTIIGDFWLQSTVEAKNIIACARHLNGAFALMPDRDMSKANTGGACVVVRRRVNGNRWR